MTILPKYHKIINDKERAINPDDKCAICESINGLSKHHILTKGFLQMDVPENLIVFCLSCHRNKHDNIMRKSDHKELWELIKEKYFDELGYEKKIG